MSDVLPVNADKIFVEWATCDGGVGITAYTDDQGRAYLGIYPLNCIGKPSGLPCWFRRTCLMSDIVVGFNKGSPIVVFIDVRVTMRGLSLVLTIPFEGYGKYQRHMSARWGSEPPRYGYTCLPTKSSRPTRSFPQSIEV